MTKIHIHDNPLIDGKDIYITMRKGDKMYAIKRIEFEEYEVDEYSATNPEPSLRITSEVFDAFSDAIKAYADKEGIKTKNENLIEGKLEATEYHLEDLRNILINKKVL